MVADAVLAQGLEHLLTQADIWHGADTDALRQCVRSGNISHLIAVKVHYQSKSVIEWLVKTTPGRSHWKISFEDIESTVERTHTLRDSAGGCSGKRNVIPS